MNIQCTKTLLDKLKIKKEDIKIDGLVLNQDLNNWHCNLMKFGTTNTILLTNDKTLYSFFITGYKADDFKNFKVAIGEDIFTILRHLDFTQKQIEVILDSLQNITISKSSNRSITSSMTQIKRFVEYEVFRDDYDLVEANRKINTIIHTKLEYKNSYEAFIALLDYNI
jgi:hypothetical protein